MIRPDSVKTRLGFAKSDLSGDGARASGRSGQRAPTVAGREAALPRPPEPAPVAAEPAPVAPEAAPALPEPSHTGKSNFPARAGFWGRRNDEGELVPLTDPGFLVRSWQWRARLARALRALFIVLGSAAMGFVAVYLVMEVRRPKVVAPVVAPVTAPVPAAPAVPAPVAAPVPISAAAKAEPARPKPRPKKAAARPEKPTEPPRLQRL
jgi:hypothetical protein